jgi:hypothetical protein
MIGPVVRTSNGIAFTTASGPEQVADGGIAVVAVDGRYAFVKIEGKHAKLDMRHIAYYALGVDHVAAPPPAPPVTDAGKPTGTKPR